MNKELDNILNLCIADDIESKKLGVALMHELNPEKATYDEYIQNYQSWILEDQYNYFKENYYYEFSLVGYAQYLGLNIPNQNIWTVKSF